MREAAGRGSQGKAKISYAQFVRGLVVHALHPSGSLGHHLRTMTGVFITDSAAIQRRDGLRWEWFVTLFKQILRPLAQRSNGLHDYCFYHGHRLLALDGSEWSLRNTKAVTDLPRPRPKNQHQSEAAFAKWGTVVLLELGTHQPLAAACEQPGLDHEEGELNIARRVLEAIPQDEETLLIEDRLYGCGRFLADTLQACGSRCQILVRVKLGNKVTFLEALEDKSALVEVRVCHPGTNRLQRVIRLREIRGFVWRQPVVGSEAKTKAPAERTEVRLWTTLLDAKAHPAQELLALYAQRWEQELFFRELKRHVGREHLLRSGSVSSAEAEYGALLIAASLVAEQRLLAAERMDLPPTRISVSKIGKAMEALLPVLSVGRKILSALQTKKLIEEFLAHAAREAVIPPRRKRGCQRAMRKPTCAWPRVQSRFNLDGAVFCELMTPTFP